MRRILPLLAGAAVLTLPAAAAARPQSPGRAHGFLVVRRAFSDAGVEGRPVATVAIKGFVLGHIAQEGAVEIFHFGSGSAAQVSGIGVSRRTVFYRRQSGVRFSGSDFRFRAVGGFWRVVVYGAGISLYAAGRGGADLHGSVFFPRRDGVYSLDGGPLVSLPSGSVHLTLGGPQR